MFIEASDVPASYQHLRVRLRIEQTRLLNWGQKINLVKELVDRPSQVLQQNRNLILDILLEIQAIFKGCVAIQDKYDSLLSKDNTARQHASLSQDTFDQRFPKKMDAFLSKTLSVLEKTPEVPKRLQWAIIKKDRFEGMISKLVGYNDSIEALLDSTAIDQLQQLQQHTYMALLQLNTNVKELKEVSMALKVKAETSPDQLQLRNPVPSEETTDGATVDIARLADFKAKQMQVETTTSVPLSPLSFSSISLLSTTTASYHVFRSLALFQQTTPIWIEWKYIDIDLSLYPRFHSIIASRVQKLALLLQPPNKPPEFNAPQCLGYYFDAGDDDSEGRYGFAYSKPAHAPPSASPVSLLEIIQGSPRSPRSPSHPPPSLSKRVALAHTVARSLMYFHSVNWIHKGLRSDNIIFFASRSPSHKTPEDLDLAQPPLIAGFEYARPDFADEATEPPPEHSEHDRALAEE